MSKSVFPLQVADCEKRIAKSHESRSFYIFKRYLNKILNEAGKLGLVSIGTGIKKLARVGIAAFCVSHSCEVLMHYSGIL